MNLLFEKVSHSPKLFHTVSKNSEEFFLTTECSKISQEEFVGGSPFHFNQQSQNFAPNTSTSNFSYLCLNGRYSLPLVTRKNLVLNNLGIGYFCFSLRKMIDLLVCIKNLYIMSLDTGFKVLISSCLLQLQIFWKKFSCISIHFVEKASILYCSYLLVCHWYFSQSDNLN